MIRIGLILLMAFGFMTSPVAAQQSFVKVKGKLSQPINADILITKNVNGKIIRFASYTTSANDPQFTFILPLSDEGFFSLNVTRKLSKEERHDKKIVLNHAIIPLYLKPGMNVELKINASKNVFGNCATYEIVNESAENKALHQWYNLAAPVIAPAQNHLDPVLWATYYQKYRQLTLSLKKFQNTIHVNTNPRFTELMKIMVDADIRFSPLFFFNLHSELKKPEAYRSIKPVIEPLLTQVRQYKNPKVLELGMGIKMVSLSPFLTEHVKKNVQTGSIISGDAKNNNLQIPGVAIVTGKIDSRLFSFDTDLFLKEVVNGDLREVTSFRVSKAANDAFYLAIPLKKEGFYYISGGVWKFRIYLKPGDNLELRVTETDKNSGLKDYTGFTYQVVNGSTENQLMQQWFICALPITRYSYNYAINQDPTTIETYQTVYHQAQAKIDTFKRSINTSNAHFNELLKAAIDIDREYAPYKFFADKSNWNATNPLRTVWVIEKMSSFFKPFIVAQKFCNAKVLAVAEAKEYMNFYTKLNLALLPETVKKAISVEDELTYMTNSICNDTLKGYFVDHKLTEIETNNLSEFKQTFEPLKKYLTSDELKQNYYKKLGKFIGDTLFIGKPVYPFSLPDTTGKLIPISSFKGKVVVIDVWASWCGPCKEQFPYLKNIEAAYGHRNDIVFMGISTDRAVDKQKWIDVIKKEKLPGLQLVDYSGKDFQAKLKIEAIPRFLLIDKEGKWIEVNCPRPTDSKAFKKYLDAALK